MHECRKEWIEFWWGYAWPGLTVIIKKHSRGTKGMQTLCLRAANTVLSFLNPAVITCDGLDAICWSWSLLNLLPIPNEKSSIPLRFKLLAGWTTLSCEMPSVRMTRTDFLPLILPREKRNLGTTKYLHTMESWFFKPFTVSHFAPFKGIQDSPGFWIPRFGFRIPGTGF